MMMMMMMVDDLNTITDDNSNSSAKANPVRHQNPDMRPDDFQNLTGTSSYKDTSVIKVFVKLRSVFFTSSC